VDYERTPWEKRRSEQRKRDAALRYSLEMESRKLGWGDPALVYDEEKDLFRFRDWTDVFRGSGLYTVLGRAFLTPLLAWPRVSYPTSSVALSFAPLKHCAGASVVRA
jgi:hypothetical protein